MAALIAKGAGVEAEIVAGDRGEFSVWVGEVRVAQKDRRGFPDETEVVDAVKRALGAGRST